MESKGAARGAVTRTRPGQGLATVDTIVYVQTKIGTNGAGKSTGGLTHLQNNTMFALSLLLGELKLGVRNGLYLQR